MKLVALVCTAALLAGLTLAPVPAPAAGPVVIRDMEDPGQVRIGELDREGQKVPVGAATVVPGKVGQALQLSFIDQAKPGFVFIFTQPAPEWDQAAGLSFWVKGDGTPGYTGISLVCDDAYRMRYASCFSTASTEWRKVEIPWSSFIPEKADIPVFGVGEAVPSNIRAIGFGKWFYWGLDPENYAAITFSVDQLSLEPKLRVDRRDYTPRRAGTPNTLATLRAKKPVTLVTVGDSLSDKHHWANRELLWSELLVKNLQEQYGSTVTLVNPAIGGTELTQGLVVSPRWLAKAPAPDLITICYGYNDFSDGATPALFRDKLRYMVDSLRRATNGRSEIVLLTTAPALQRWTEMEGLAQAVREVAQEKKTGLADIAAAFHKAGDTDEAARTKLFAWDAVHLGADGHRLVAATVQQAITGSK